MIVEKVAREVLANVLAERLLQKCEVVLEMLLAEGVTQEAAKPRSDVVGEPVAIEYGNHIVDVRLKSRTRNLGAIMLKPLALVREDQTGHIEAIAPEHAAHRVGHELPHRV